MVRKENIRISVDSDGKLSINPNGIVIWNMSKQEAEAYIVKHNREILPPKTKDKLLWDLDKLNESTIKKLIMLHNEKNFIEIFKIHNELELTQDIKYCCIIHQDYATKNINRLYGVL
jgi:hypothetical protein